MSATSPLGSVLEAGGLELARGLEQTERRLVEIVGDQGADLAPHASSTLAAGGKRLRPMLVFLCGRDSGAGLVAAAAAVELLHMATLVHDDVLDGASLRRGKPTVFATGGRAAATATGDLLFSRAFAELASTGSERAVASLSAASSELARGELMQRDDAFAPDVTKARYLDRCALKTASLFAAACRIGAALGMPDRRSEQTLGSFGRETGLAFQILDDILDISGSSSRTGKQRGADLLDGTVTLPLIIARRRDRHLERLDLRTLEGDAATAEAVCNRIAATGALHDARAEALRFVRKAKAAVATLDLPPSRLKALDLVADGVVERYS